jgi:hypothetical protein
MRWAALDTSRMAQESYFVTVCDAEVKIENGLGKLPCDVFRVKSAVKQGSGDGTCSKIAVPYTTDAIFLRPTYMKEGTMLVTYTAIPTDEKGLPCIPEYMLEGVAWNAIYKLYQQKYMDGDINENRWGHIQERYETERAKVLYDRSAFTDDDYNVMQWIQRNVIWPV